MTEENNATDPTICYYCRQLMGNEIHKVIKGSEVVDAHKRCHNRAQGGEINVRMIIK